MLNAKSKSAIYEVPPSRDDIFAENYEQLRVWALHFSEGNRNLAEDLLHDAFIQFTISEADLNSIQNVDAYLYVLMRNLHLSQVRRATRNPVTPLAAVDFDTANIGLWASDPRDGIRLRDELCSVCEYACRRKETAKAGSVLILRFFHGYYPEEIGRVMRVARSAVHNRIALARAEAKIYLEDPERLTVINDKAMRKHYAGIRIDPISGDLRLQLRHAIFETRTGECLSRTEIESLYREAHGDGPEQQTLAHIVACETCIETVNSTLDLPPLSSRYPVDSIGNDPTHRKGGGGGSGSGGGTGAGGGGSDMFQTFSFRRDEIMGHQPQELRISINGYLHGAQKVAGDLNEMTLVIDGPESVGFVEVFSEQGLRLLMLNVDPPPSGESRQAMRSRLGEGRYVDADLTFSGPHPVLKVIYKDPTLEAEALAIDVTAAPLFAESVTTNDFVPATWTSRLREFFDLKHWLQPMRLAFTVTLLLVAVGGYWFVTHEPSNGIPSARSVLTQARNSEFTLVSAADKVVHRNYQVEEWSNGDLRSRSRVDQWEKKDAGAKRTYDEQGRMVAGVWTRSDGSEQVFTQGEKIKTLQNSQRVEHTDPIRDNEPTATAFANLMDLYGVADRVHIAATPTLYTFNFVDRKGETAQVKMPGRLLVASLTLDRNTLLPTTESITVQVGDETREYRYSDVRVEQRQASDVSPLVFEIEAELAKGATRVTKPLQPTDIDAEPGVVENNAGTTVTRATATLETEVEVFKALDGINALSGEQITVNRTPDGHLRVVGIVDTPARKTEILNTLASVRNQPGVVLSIETAAEATARLKQNIRPDQIQIENATPATSALPVESELKAYFARRGVAADRMDEETRAYAAAVVNRSQMLRRKALALKQLAERFSPGEIERMDPAKRDEWRGLMRSKAAAIVADVRSLTSQLAAVLGQQGTGGDGGADVRDAASAAQAAQRLFGLAAACDGQITDSFTISTRGSSAPVKSVQFWRNLRQMADIAGEIQRY